MKNFPAPEVTRAERINMKNWRNLINEKREEIQESGEKAYRDALENPDLRFIVEIDSEGDLGSWCDLEDGNDYHRAADDREILQLMSISFRYRDVDGEEWKQIFIKKMKESGNHEDLGKLIKKSEQEGESLLAIVSELDEFEKIMRAVESEMIENEVREHAAEEVSIKIDEILEDLGD